MRGSRSALHTNGPISVHERSPVGWLYLEPPDAKRRGAAVGLRKAEALSARQDAAFADRSDMVVMCGDALPR